MTHSFTLEQLLVIALFLAFGASAHAWWWAKRFYSPEHGEIEALRRERNHLTGQLMAARLENDELRRKSGRSLFKALAP